MKRIAREMENESKFIHQDKCYVIINILYAMYAESLVLLKDICVHRALSPKPVGCKCWKGNRMKKKNKNFAHSQILNFRLELIWKINLMQWRIPSADGNFFFSFTRWNELHAKSEGWVYRPWRQAESFTIFSSSSAKTSTQRRFIKGNVINACNSAWNKFPL